jgi:hypothetical protein
LCGERHRGTNKGEEEEEEQPRCKTLSLEREVWKSSEFFVCFFSCSDDGAFQRLELEGVGGKKGRELVCCLL